MTLREALADVYTKHGRLSAQLVVDEATRNRSAAGKFLYGKFNWDNDGAADAWRLHQAQELIRSIRTKYREPTETEVGRSVRTYHSVPTPEGRVYSHLDDVVGDEFTRALVLRDMERQWKALHRRFAEFTEFTEMVQRDLDVA